MAKKNKHQLFVREALKLLTGYPYARTYKEIREELEGIGRKFSKATISNVSLEKSSVSLPTWRRSKEALEELLTLKYGAIYNEEKKKFHIEESFVPEKKMGRSSSPSEAHALIQPPGTSSFYKSIRFTQQATKSVVIVWASFNEFAAPAFSLIKGEIRKHLLGCLENGVNVSIFIPHYNDSFLGKYLEHLNKNSAIEYSHNASDWFKGIGHESREMRSSARFEAFMFKHMPTHNCITIDDSTESGKMLVTPIVYGISEDQYPTFEIRKASHPVIFEQYLASFRKTRANVKKIF
ncbi:MAG: hypothetical protein AAFZ15_13735 [Bacteroidota bacterium]